MNAFTNNKECCAIGCTNLTNYAFCDSCTEERVVQAAEEREKVQAIQETDPYGKSPHEMGAKLDQGKPPVMQGVLEYFPRALQAVADVSAHGATKYAWKSWAEVPDAITRYGNALGRHICQEAIQGPIDRDSNLLHKAHIAWNALAVLEMTLIDKEKDQKSL